MALTKSIEERRLLIVLAADGTIKGIQCEDLERIVDGAEEWGERYAPARPMTEADLAAVLPDLALALAQVENAQRQQAVAEAGLGDAAGQIEAAKRVIASLQTKLQAAVEGNQSLVQRIAELTVEPEAPAALNA